MVTVAASGWTATRGVHIPSLWFILDHMWGKLSRLLIGGASSSLSFVARSITIVNWPWSMVCAVGPVSFSVIGAATTVSVIIFPPVGILVSGDVGNSGRMDHAHG